MKFPAFLFAILVFVTSFVGQTVSLPLLTGDALEVRAEGKLEAGTSLFVSVNAATDTKGSTLDASDATTNNGTNKNNKNGKKGKKSKTEKKNNGRKKHNKGKNEGGKKGGKQGGKKKEAADGKKKAGNATETSGAAA